MQQTTATSPLRAFRQGVYRTLGRRTDTLFELQEAALAGAGPANLVHLSLVPAFRRQWASASDAPAEGQVRPAQCRALIHRSLEEPPAGARPIWVGDGTTWPRPRAKTSPERTWGHRSTPGVPQDGIVPAWEYEWLMAVPEPGTSWVQPLALLAGSILTYLAATLPALPTGSWARRPRPTPGRLRRRLAHTDFPTSFPLPGHIRQKASVTAHLPTGFWGQRCSSAPTPTASSSPNPPLNSVQVA